MTIVIWNRCYAQRIAEQIIQCVCNLDIITIGVGIYTNSFIQMNYLDENLSLSRNIADNYYLR